MIFDASSGLRGRWYRADTGERVRWVQSYDTDTHVFTAFRIDPVIAERNGLDLKGVLYSGTARLRFEQTGVAPARPKPRPFVPPLNQRHFRCLLLPTGEWDKECEEPKCHARATWGVSDIEEVKGEDGYERAAVKATRYYCEPCYKRNRLRPTATNARGVTRELTEVVQP